MLALAYAIIAGPVAHAQSADSSSDLPDAPSITAQAAPELTPTGPTIVFDTSMGRMVCKTFIQEAPKAVANFIGLAQGTKDWTNAASVKQHGKRYYDGTIFHRVLPGFMIQGGDRTGTGLGDPGYLFADEIVPSLTFDVPGRLAMANSGPDTNGSQFFITEQAEPDLNGKYTVFGQCDPSSVLIEASIARVPRDANDKPITSVVLNHVTIVPDGQPLPPLPQPPATATNAKPRRPAVPALIPR